MFSRPWPKRQFANSLGEKNYENEWCFSFFTPAIYFLIYYDYVRKRLATVTIASLSLSFSPFLLSFFFFLRFFFFICDLVVPRPRGARPTQPAEPAAWMCGILKKKKNPAEGGHLLFLLPNL